MVQSNQAQIDDAFHDEQILAPFQVEVFPWFADIANYLATCIIPYNLTAKQKKIFFAKVQHYCWTHKSALFT